MTYNTTTGINTPTQTFKYRTGDPMPETPLASLQTFAVRCGPTQHDYWQGQDSIEHPEGQFAHLLFCRQCGDVITFGLPSAETLG